jgi:hypothetical protein
MIYLKEEHEKFQAFTEEKLISNPFFFKPGKGKGKFKSKKSKVKIQYPSRETMIRNLQDILIQNETSADKFGIKSLLFPNEKNGVKFFSLKKLQDSTLQKIYKKVFYDNMNKIKHVFKNENIEHFENEKKRISSLSDKISFYSIYDLEKSKFNLIDNMEKEKLAKLATQSLTKQFECDTQEEAVLKLLYELNKEEFEKGIDPYLYKDEGTDGELTVNDEKIKNEISTFVSAFSEETLKIFLKNTDLSIDLKKNPKNKKKNPKNKKKNPKNTKDENNNTQETKDKKNNKQETKDKKNNKQETKDKKNKKKNQKNNKKIADYNVFTEDAGGDGDCLYHSIAKGLNYMKEANVVLNNKLFDKKNSFSMQWVRNMSALGFDEKYMTNEMFLDKYHNFLNQVMAGTWKDEWTPEMDLLFKNPVTGDVYTTEGFIESLKSNKTKIKHLRETVKENISTTGNRHWGVDYDITNISNVLNISFIILKGDKQIYCLPVKNTTYYMFIYYISETHFQLGFVDDKCFYKCEDLPKPLLHQFNNKCKDNQITCT